jgi:hypothetical protein
MAEDAFWQSFATKQRLAIVACRFTDKPHEQSFLEDYVEVSGGSGQALIDAVSSLARNRITRDRDRAVPDVGHVGGRTSRL